MRQRLQSSLSLLIFDKLKQMAFNLLDLPLSLSRPPITRVKVSDYTYFHAIHSHDSERNLTAGMCRQAKRLFHHSHVEKNRCHYTTDYRPSKKVMLLREVSYSK